MSRLSLLVDVGETVELSTDDSTPIAKVHVKEKTGRRTKITFEADKSVKIELKKKPSHESESDS